MFSERVSAVCGYPVMTVQTVRGNGVSARSRETKMGILLFALIMLFPVNVLTHEDDRCGVVCVWDGGDNRQGAFVGFGDHFTVSL